ncbi:hypothetical protein FOXB_12472, partial [Fusarium oxysporum f. sp. conglutinans Fo5176]
LNSKALICNYCLN